jgi:hypothetical protein
MARQGDGGKRPYDDETKPNHMTPTLTEDALRGGLLPRIEQLAGDLRPAISTVLESVAGTNPRPARVSRATGLDKSLASRLVRAVQANSDADLMHLVPSPSGLHIFAQAATRLADPASIANLLVAIERFEELLDAVPGGRAAIDAQLSESSTIALEKREHIAKQASFKAMSFLLGHSCDMITTTLFVVPSANPKRVDTLEVHRRIGLRRMRPSTPLALLSLWLEPADAAEENAISFRTIDGDTGASGPEAFLLPGFTTQPIPELRVERDGHMTTLVLPGDPAVHPPSQLTSAFRVQNALPLEPESKLHMLRGYVLHTPCRKLVRDVFVAESLYPGVTARVSYVLPGGRAATRPPRQGGTRHFTELDLTTSIEQLPSGPQAFTIPGVTNHGAALRHVLERTGHGLTRFRGWRCSVTYPVPLIEMLWWLAHPGHEQE